MTVKEVMAGITPSADYAGLEMADDFVLAFQTADTQQNVNDYIVCQACITEHSAAVNPGTQDKQYIRKGNVTIKTSAQRTFSISGDRHPRRRLAGLGHQPGRDVRHRQRRDRAVCLFLHAHRQGRNRQGLRHRQRRRLQRRRQQRRHLRHRLRCGKAYGIHLQRHLSFPQACPRPSPRTGIFYALNQTDQAGAAPAQGPTKGAIL